MNRRLEETKNKWNAEVEEEICKLIEEGTPPVDAAERAVGIVSRRRKAAAESREAAKQA
jgi:hypothetical protein